MFFVYVFLNTFVTGENLGNMPALFLFAGLDVEVPELRRESRVLI